MKNFKDYIEEKEDMEDDVLNEDGNAGLQAAAIILGIPTIGLLAAFGGTLMVYAYSKGINKLADIWRKIISNFKDFKGKKATEMIAQVKRDPLVKHEINKGIENKREYADVLKDVYECLDKKDFITLREKYQALTPAFKNLPAVKQIIINELTKSMSKPPIWPPTPGNKTYKAIRNVLGLQEAKAAARAVSYSASKIIQEE
jgi:hypothetical protein